MRSHEPKITHSTQCKVFKKKGMNKIRLLNAQRLSTYASNFSLLSFYFHCFLPLSFCSICKTFCVFINLWMKPVQFSASNTRINNKCKRMITLWCEWHIILFSYCCFVWYEVIQRTELEVEGGSKRSRLLDG